MADGRPMTLAGLPLLQPQQPCPGDASQANLIPRPGPVAPQRQPRRHGAGGLNGDRQRATGNIAADQADSPPDPPVQTFPGKTEPASLRPPPAGSAKAGTRADLRPWRPGQRDSPPDSGTPHPPAPYLLESDGQPGWYPGSSPAVARQGVPARHHHPRGPTPRCRPDDDENNAGSGKIRPEEPSLAAAIGRNRRDQS